MFHFGPINDTMSSVSALRIVLKFFAVEVAKLHMKIKLVKKYCLGQWSILGPKMTIWCPHCSGSDLRIEKQNKTNDLPEKILVWGKWIIFGSKMTMCSHNSGSALSRLFKNFPQEKWPRGT